MQGFGLARGRHTEHHREHLPTAAVYVERLGVPALRGERGHQPPVYLFGERLHLERRGVDFRGAFGIARAGTFGGIVGFGTSIMLPPPLNGSQGHRR